MSSPFWKIVGLNCRIEANKRPIPASCPASRARGSGYRAACGKDRPLVLDPKIQVTRCRLFGTDLLSTSALAISRRPIRLAVLCPCDYVELKRLKISSVLEFCHFFIIPKMNVSCLRSIIWETSNRFAHFHEDKDRCFSAQ